MSQLFDVREKGTERGLHAAIAWVAVLFLTIAFRSREKAEEQWSRFATLMPTWRGWALYTRNTNVHLVTVAHENQHVEDAETLTRPLFILLYLVNPLTLTLVITLATTWGPWWWLAIVLVGTPNPARAILEWRAYQAEYETRELLRGTELADQWAEKLPRLFYGPAYGFMSPLWGLWLRRRG